ncbi:MAG: hypothetical protein O3B21_03360 [Proteobacteria bacterium]|nr:hypothetical protein [Pseudomonadota bacterium]MDA1357027.1 hypothetical protein [Pseudomonadota bacterium]
MSKNIEIADKQQTQHQLDMATQPAKRLRMMLAAGEDVLEIWRVLALTDDNVVGEILRHQGMFYRWDHYPKGDVYDRQSHAQYFYHAHSVGGRDPEHGHFHTFMRAKGMARGVKPINRPDRSAWPTGTDALSHIIGISMDAKGMPIRLFTTNRWVTGEAWYKARDVVKMIGLYSIDHVQPSWPSNRWVSGMVRLFWPQIIVLIQARDLCIQAWEKQNPGKDVFEDRGLEVTSQADIDVDVQIAAVKAALAVKADAKQARME